MESSAVANYIITFQKIILCNLVDSLKSELQLMSMLTGVEVQSYEVGGHCCVVFHLQHDAETEIKHGLRIDLDTGELQKTTNG